MAQEATVRQKYRDLTLLLIERNITISTMESCTAGQIASLITDTEGSSAIFRGSYVTYCNAEKVRLGIPAKVIEEFGVYSEQTASEMAKLCKADFRTDLGVGISGSFGNTDPNNNDSIPGEVFFAISTEKGTKGYHCTIPEQKTRLDYKLHMADVIADHIMETLGK
ncbi:MAG: CinA family protein [Spirochaetales bacterium]|nr:CinA family protein [Spirochaetales bacterium]